MNKEKEVIKIPLIKLEWSDWSSWDNLKIDARKGGDKFKFKGKELNEVSAVVLSYRQAA
jgi:long-subunit fatty acid transport protein